MMKWFKSRLFMFIFLFGLFTILSYAGVFDRAGNILEETKEAVTTAGSAHPEAQAGETVKVSRVIDGDTFKIEDGRTIRLIGVNTPETKHPDKPVEFYGKEASNFTDSLLSGKTVTLKYGPDKKGPYGRTLAYVHMDDIFLNRILIKKGFGEVSMYAPNTSYEEEFQAMEKEAREKRIGMWSRPR